MIARRIAESIARHTARRFNCKNARLKPDGPIISFTFDDVPISAVEVGARILEDAGARGTYYVCAGLLSEMAEYGVRCACYGLIEALADRGHEIACHTATHRRVGELSPATLREDLDRNASAFRKIGPLHNFAYPYNAPATQPKRILGERFRSARGGLPGINIGNVDLCYLRSVPLQSAPVQGLSFEQWIADACASKGWLVFFTHDIEKNPSPYGTTPELLARAIEVATSNGASIMTVDAALNAMGVPAAAEIAATAQVVADRETVS